MILIRGLGSPASSTDVRCDNHMPVVGNESGSTCNVKEVAP